MIIWRSWVIPLYLLLVASFFPLTDSNVIDQEPPDNIKLGGLFPISANLNGAGEQSHVAARMAVHEINNNPDILPDTTLELIVRDTKTSPSVGIVAAQEVIDEGAVGLIGAASSAVTKEIAQGPSIANKVPQITHYSTDPTLSNSLSFPYLMRIISPDHIQGVALSHLVKNWNITEVATLSTSDFYGSYVINTFSIEASKLNISITTAEEFETGNSRLVSQLQSIRQTGTSTIVLNAIGDDISTVFDNALDLEMTAANGFIWMGTKGLTQTAIFGYNQTLQRAMQGILGVDLNTGLGDRYEQFRDLWETCAGLNSSVFPGCGDRALEKYTALAYDGVYTFAYAFEKMIDDDLGDQISNGTRLLEYLHDTHFTGATGEIVYNQVGDRLGTYNILNLVGGEFITVGTWDTVNGYIEQAPPNWDGNLDDVPNSPNSLDNTLQIVMRIAVEIVMIVIILGSIMTAVVKARTSAKK